MNRILNNIEAKSYTDKGIDLKSNSSINYHFSVIINAKRYELFEITFNKFLNDGLVYTTNSVSTKQSIQVECIKDINDDYYKVSKKNSSTPFYLQRKNDIYVRSEEDLLFHNVLHKKIKFDFICHPLVVIKVITDLKDVVDFIDKSYVYDLDGTEILKHKYPIGSILMYQKGFNYDITTIEFKRPEAKQVTVLAYDYERNIHKVSYIVHDEMSGFNFNAFEEELSVSRDINLDSLLDN